MTTSGADGATPSAEALFDTASRFFKLEAAKLRAELAAHTAAGEIPASFGARVEELERAALQVEACFVKHGLIK